MTEPIRVVLSGSFRWLRSLQYALDMLRSNGFSVISPATLKIAEVVDGFCRLVGDTGTPAEIERKHIEAISRADFLWVDSPAGYVGPSMALEIGVAHGAGIPIFSSSSPKDPAFQSVVTLVRSLDEVRQLLHANTVVTVGKPPLSLRSQQLWYRRIADELGFDKEGDAFALLNSMEELGELAREVSVKHGFKPRLDRAPRTGKELADLQMTVLHVANLLGHDLPSVMAEKAREFSLPRSAAKKPSKDYEDYEDS